MKNITLIIFAFFIFSCGSSSQERAEKNIEKYIRENSDDPTGYEKVEFGRLDSIFDTPKIEAEDIFVMDSKIGNYLDSLFVRDLESYSAARDSVFPKIAMKEAEVKSGLKNGKYKISGYFLDHQFRVKENNKLKLKYYRFTLDTLLNVTDYTELKRKKFKM